MYLGVKSTTRLLAQKQGVAVYSILNTAFYEICHPLHAFVLAACNGQVTRTDLVTLLREGVGLETNDAIAEVERSLAILRPHCEFKAQAFNVNSPLNPLDYLYTPHGDPHVQRLAAPINIDWIVTERCPFSCVYCCVNTVAANVKNTKDLTTEEATLFLEDCIETGVHVFTLSGGEPFLRPDLPDLIDLLLRHKRHINTSTKMPLKPATVKRLAQSGLPELQVSIDSINADTAAQMTGHPHHLERAWATVAQLEAHGIAPRVNAVVTSQNIEGLPALLEACLERGVRRIMFSGYIRAFRNHDDRLFPERERLFAIDHQIRSLLRDYEDVDYTSFPLEDPRDASLSMPGLSSCSGGRSGLVIGADGSVATCDRLVTVDEAVVGNVRDARIMEIWTGKPLGRLMDPAPSEFADRACASCENFANCNFRVRCYFRANLIHGTIFGPDFLCPKMPEAPMRFF